MVTLGIISDIKHYEAKILEDIASRITDSNVSGTIILYSELLKYYSRI